MSEKRTYFINFVNGDAHLGGAIVEVAKDEFTPEEIARIISAQGIAQPNSEWSARLMLKCLKEGCFPRKAKGEMVALRIDTLTETTQRSMDKFPRNTLLSEQDLRDYGCVSIPAASKVGQMIVSQSEKAELAATTTTRDSVWDDE